MRRLSDLIAALDQLEVPAATPVAGAADNEASSEETEFVAEVEGIYTEKLPAVYPGWESRPQQVEMAKAVARALIRGKSCLAEAGTGSGKALALLGPAVLYARRTGGTVIVSTGTHVLQEQYLRKDVPRLQEAIGRFSVALMKGRGNYLCLKRLHEELEQPSLDDLMGEVSALDDIFQWSEQTETGDRAELTLIPAVEWARVCADDSCTRTKCPFYDRCFLFKARREAAQADIVICNHALLVADILVRRMTYGMGSLLPEPVAIILDEAHHLENVARENLGTTLTETRLGRILRDLRKHAPRIDAGAVSTCLDANNRLFATVRRLAGEEDRAELEATPAIQAAVERLQTALGAVAEAAKREKRRAPSEEAAATIDNIIERIEAYAADVDSIVTHGEDRVVWAEVLREGDQTRVLIHATPVEVAQDLRSEIFSRPTVCASATMTTGRSFDYFRTSVGVPEDALEFICDSPFDYRANARVYVPERLPDPKARDFHEKIAGDVEELLRVSEGRAFVLCTSWRGARELYQRIAPSLPYRCLLQGDAPRGEILDVFQHDVHSVLFATASFWEGVDVPGEALSLVVLDKLPFGVPTDPVTRAKVQAIEARGGNAFMSYSVPEAILRLRQGFGRLIRSQSDRGVVAIFDRRIVEARYGSLFRSSLPPAPMVRRLEDVQRFFGEGVAA